MKLPLLVVFAAAAGVASLPTAAGITDTGKRLAHHPEFIQAKFTADDKPVMYIKNLDETDHEVDQYVILDEAFNEVRTLSFSFPAVTATYTVWRNIQGPIGIRENRELRNEVSGITLEQFIQEGQGRGFLRREDHGAEVWLMPADEYAYFAYEAYGYKYPQELMVWATNNMSIYSMNYDYDSYGPIPGKYEEPVTEEDTYTPVISDLYRKTSDCVDYDDVEISQTLFNTDALFEGLVPVYTVYDASYVNENEKVEGQRVRISGYKVVSENGSTITSFDLPAGYSMRYDDVYLYEVGGKNYLLLYCSTNADADNSEDAYVVYEIDPASASVRQVTEPRKVRVSPTTPRRGTSVNVEFGAPAAENSKIVVTSVNGRTVLSRTVAPGTTATSIDTDRFEAGMYIVTVTDGRTSREATKIIVR